jgi:hypothetical protein
MAMDQSTKDRIAAALAAEHRETVLPAPAALRWLVDAFLIPGMMPEKPSA